MQFTTKYFFHSKITLKKVKGEAVFKQNIRQVLLINYCIRLCFFKVLFSFDIIFI